MVDSTVMKIDGWAATGGDSRCNRGNSRGDRGNSRHDRCYMVLFWVVHMVDVYIDWDSSMMWLCEMELVVCVQVVEVASIDHRQTDSMRMMEVTMDWDVSTMLLVSMR